MKLITVYTDKLNNIAQGDKGDRELLRWCKPTYGNFRAAIRRTAPHFIPRQSQRSHFSTQYELETGSDEGNSEFFSDLPRRPNLKSDDDGSASDIFSASEDSDDGGDHELRSKDR